MTEQHSSMNEDENLTEEQRKAIAEEESKLFDKFADDLQAKGQNNL